MNCLALASKWPGAAGLCRRLGDGVAAQRELLTQSHSAVVLDLGLPRQDGLITLRAVRAKGSEHQLILTALDALPKRIEGLDAGADDYLIKPVDLGELAARLRALGAAMPMVRVRRSWWSPALRWTPPRARYGLQVRPWN